MNCKRFQFQFGNICHHESLASPSFYTLSAVFCIPIAVAVSTATGFGSAAFQIFILMLLFNYGRKDSSTISNPMQAGLYLSSCVRNLYKKNDAGQPLVNYTLALLVIPNMITGAVAGIHYKEYLPSLLSNIFFVLQLLVLIYSTHVKSKQFKALQVIHQQPALIASEDGIELNIEELVQKIGDSPDKDAILKQLPTEIMELDITIDEHKIRVKDYLNENKHIARKLHSQLDQVKIPTFKLLVLALIILANLILIRSQGISQEGDSCYKLYYKQMKIQFIMNFSAFIIIALVTSNFKVKLLLQLSFIGLVLGFCLGFVGMGAAVFLIIALGKVKDVVASKSEISATMPLIMLSVTLTNYIISIVTGVLYDINGSLVMFVLSFIGQYFLNPPLSKILPAQKIINYAKYFQILLLVVYLGISAIKIIKTPIMDQLRIQKHC